MTHSDPMAGWEQHRRQEAHYNLHRKQSFLFGTPNRPEAYRVADTARQLLGRVGTFEPYASIQVKRCGYREPDVAFYATYVNNISLAEAFALRDTLRGMGHDAELREHETGFVTPDIRAWDIEEYTPLGQFERQPKNEQPRALATPSHAKRGHAKSASRFGCALWTNRSRDVWRELAAGWETVEQRDRAKGVSESDIRRGLRRQALKSVWPLILSDVIELLKVIALLKSLGGTPRGS